MNDPILDELKKISSYVDFQKKVTRWSFFVLIGFLLVFVPTVIFFECYFDQKIKETSEPSLSDWFDVSYAARKGNFDKAIEVGNALILKTPDYPEGHFKLAEAYLAKGDTLNAQKHFQTAYTLFPTKEYQESLDAINQRIKSKAN